MLSHLANVLFTATALAPVGLAYGVMALLDCSYAEGSAILLICTFLWVVCIALLRVARKTLEQFALRPRSVELVDRESLGIMVLYLFPLFRASFADLHWYMLIPFGVIFLSLVVTSQDHHFNPLLNLLGWHFYKVDTTEGVSYVLITKRKIRNANEEITVGQLTNYTLIDVQEN